MQDESKDERNPLEQPSPAFGQVLDIDQPPKPKFVSKLRQPTRLHDGDSSKNRPSVAPNKAPLSFPKNTALQPSKPAVKEANNLLDGLKKPRTFTRARLSRMSENQSERESKKRSY